MKKHYECEPLPFGFFKNGPSLVFDWDEETGEISGRDKAYFDRFKPHADIKYYKPEPGYHYFLGDTLFKSKNDMAAMIHYGYILPEDLKPFCPTWEPPHVPEGCTVYY